MKKTKNKVISVELRASYYFSDITTELKSDKFNITNRHNKLSHSWNKIEKTDLFRFSQSALLEENLAVINITNINHLEDTTESHWGERVISFNIEVAEPKGILKEFILKNKNELGYFYIKNILTFPMKSIEYLDSAGYHKQPEERVFTI